jgi:hypothetical protein
MRFGSAFSAAPREESGPLIGSGFFHRQIYHARKSRGDAETRRRGDLARQSRNQTGESTENSR